MRGWYVLSFLVQLAMLMCSGIGVTPWASILKNIYHRRTQTTSSKNLIRLEFFWICKDQSQFEWFQTLLAELEKPVETKGQVHLNSPARSSFLKIHIYLTKKLGLDDIKNYILNDAEVDTFTQLRTKTKFGRPNFDSILANIRSELDGGTYIPEMQESKSRRHNVGFYFCGPGPMATGIAQSCQNQGTETVKFTFKKEHF